MRRRCRRADRRRARGRLRFGAVRRRRRVPRAARGDEGASACAQCASRGRAQAGSTLRVRGTALSGVDSMTFHGANGRGDDARAKVRAGSATRLNVKVPAGATTGPVSVHTENDQTSRRTKPLAILPGPPPEPNPDLTPVPGHAPARRSPPRDRHQPDQGLRRGAAGGHLLLPRDRRQSRERAGRAGARQRRRRGAQLGPRHHRGGRAEGLVERTGWAAPRRRAAATRSGSRSTRRTAPAPRALRPGTPPATPSTSTTTSTPSAASTPTGARARGSDRAAAATATRATTCSPAAARAWWPRAAAG